MGKWRKEPPQKEPLFRRAIHFLSTMSPSAKEDRVRIGAWKTHSSYLAGETPDPATFPHVLGFSNNRAEAKRDQNSKC